MGTPLLLLLLLSLLLLPLLLLLEAALCGIMLSTSATTAVAAVVFGCIDDGADGAVRPFRGAGGGSSRSSPTAPAMISRGITGKMKRSSCQIEKNWVKMVGASQRSMASHESDLRGISKHRWTDRSEADMPGRHLNAL